MNVMQQTVFLVINLNNFAFLFNYMPGSAVGSMADV